MLLLFSRNMLASSVIRNMSHIIHIEAPSSVCFCLTISPMLMPMKKIGTQLPENLQMSYSLMYRGDILYQDAPHDHHHRQPAVDRMALDEFSPV